jgi:dihydroorotate dehydrogenase electron transfer subunit
VKRPRRAILIWTRRVGPDIFQQRFTDPLIARQARAGQFVHLLPGSGHLFRRAFSVYATDPQSGTFDILHQVLGLGTHCLAHQPQGTVIDALGPLGNTFSRPPRGMIPVLVGGGLGMAPLRLRALELALQARRGKSHLPEPVMILGFRTRALAVKPFRLREIGIRPHWATDDGSLGLRGTAVDLFAHLIDSGTLDPAHVFACGCGPEAMMSALAQVCAGRNIPCEVSLERAMPCGYGVCMGCVVTGKNTNGYDTYRRVCRDGPVFRADTIVF